ncbi:YhjD/YihY/BrkB family envelope integrity protein [Eubacterium callanderi]
MNLSDIFIKFWQGFTLIYISAIIALLVTAIYMYTPSVRMSFFFALPGGVFVSLGWLSIIGLYEAFIKNHLQIESLFSSLEGPFSLIIVVYVFCIILTFGCVVNLFLLKKIGR